MQVVMFKTEIAEKLNFLKYQDRSGDRLLTLLCENLKEKKQMPSLGGGGGGINVMYCPLEMMLICIFATKIVASVVLRKPEFSAELQNNRKFLN